MIRTRLLSGAGGPLLVAVMSLYPVSAAGPNDSAGVILGERCYRDADFDAAARHFLSAVESAPDSSRAHLGLARLDQLRFRRLSARRELQRAYSLDSRNPEVIRAYASLAADPQQEVELLRSYLAHAAREPREQLEAAVARLQLLSQVDAGRLALLETPYERYRIRLTPWVRAAGQASGVLLTVRINGGKSLRLVFDTGAQGIYVRAAAVPRQGLRPLTESRVVGVGRSESRPATLAVAGKVEIGGLRFRNCLVTLTAAPFADDVDGVIGVGLLERFLLRLDLPHNTLELLPYPGGLPAVASASPWKDWDAPAAAPEGDILPVYRTGPLTLLRASIDGRDAGYFAVDTGASYTAVDSRLVSSAHPLWLADSLTLQGAGGGEISGARVVGPVSFRLGSHRATADRVAAFDFTSFSDRHGLRISGLLGYPLLSRSVLTLNYRDGLISFER